MQTAETVEKGRVPAFVRHVGNRIGEHIDLPLILPMKRLDEQTQSFSVFQALVQSVEGLHRILLCFKVRSTASRRIATSLTSITFPICAST